LVLNTYHYDLISVSSWQCRPYVANCIRHRYLDVRDTRISMDSVSDGRFSPKICIRVRNKMRYWIRYQSSSAVSLPCLSVIPCLISYLLIHPSTFVKSMLYHMLSQSRIWDPSTNIHRQSTTPKYSADLRPQQTKRSVVGTSVM